MNDRMRWHPEMAANQAAYDDEAAKHPPIELVEPFDPHRATNDAINEVWARGGPVMAETRDLWIGARGRRIQCRVHRPAGVPDGPLPCVVWFHGGGWVWSSIDTHDRVAREISAAGGVVTVLVDYALSPEARFPQALEECAAVIRWLGQHGASWGVDPARIVVGGDSAGGNLAFATALMLRDQGGAPALKGVLTCYPVCDSAFDRASYDEFGEGGYGLTREKMDFYWKAYVPHAADRAHPWAAPIRADLTGLPPSLLLLAELDVLRDEGLAMAERLRAAGVATASEVYPGTVHGFIRATGTVTPAKEAVARAGAWLREVFG